MIGILGGTFDPVHLGHLHIANTVLARLGLDEVQFMPCAMPVHRGAPRASAEQRCAMIELAIGGLAGMSLNRLEIDRAGPSYMVDSLREMQRRGNSALLLVLGGDAFNGFSGWCAPDEILAMAHIAVCIRPGVELDPGLYARNRVDSVAAFARSRAGAILVLEVQAPDCASSEIRDTLAMGRHAQRCLPAPVLDYIESQHLYRRSHG